MGIIITGQAAENVPDFIRYNPSPKPRSTKIKAHGLWVLGAFAALAVLVATTKK